MNNNAKTFAIAVLALTALLMLCTLLVLDRMPTSPAYAGSTPERQGDYLMIPGQTLRGEECVYVIDIASQKMGVYTANVSNSRIDAIASFDLAKLK